jgi:hypothetical protein
MITNNTLKLIFRVPIILLYTITIVLGNNSREAQFSRPSLSKNHHVKRRQQNIEKKIKIGLWSAWQIPCEIAFYTEQLKAALSMLETDIAIYKHTIEPQFLMVKINDDDLDILNIHYEPSLMPPLPDLLSTLQKIKQCKVKVVMTIHKETTTISDFSPYVDFFIYHKPPIYLTSRKKVILIPPGSPIFKPPPPSHRTLLRKKYGFSENDTIIVSHGLFLQNNDIPRIVECLAPYFKIEPTYRLQLLYSFSPLAQAMEVAEYQKLTQVIEKHQLQSQVILITDFLLQKELSERIWISDIGYKWFTITTEGMPSIASQFIAARTPLVLPHSPSYYRFEKGIVKTAHDPAILVDTLMDLTLNTSVLDQLRTDLAAIYRETNFDTIGAKYLQVFKAAHHKLRHEKQ